MPKVLIVEDNEAMRRVLLRLLTAPGRTMIAEEDGRAGLRTAQEALPDVVVLDIELPHMDGLALCRALRADPRTAGTRVLILSGADQEDAAWASLVSGADGFLPKPLGLEELESWVAALLATPQGVSR